MGINDLAASGPQYNDDFTQMIVERRGNVYWSDGTPFSADDLVPGPLERYVCDAEADRGRR